MRVLQVRGLEGVDAKLVEDLRALLDAARKLEALIHSDPSMSGDLMNCRLTGSPLRRSDAVRAFQHALFRLDHLRGSAT